MKALMICVFFALSASAAQAYQCTGPVTSVAPNGNGAIYMSGAGGLNSVMICNVVTPTHGVDPSACKAIYATLLSAKLTGANVAMYYNDSLTCSTHPAWAVLTGWYYGPEQL